MNLLAKSCFAPGLIAMISNLIQSAGDVDTGIYAHEGDWFDEYAEGLGHEIYRMQISQDDYGDSMGFKKIAEIAFSEFSGVVFGLEVQSKIIPSK
jgi:acetyl-CoA C-acetyltransferase/potassium large conductance calcium-activated channel subfamily M alpha protein 1